MYFPLQSLSCFQVYHDHAISATASEAESEANLSEEDVSPPFR